jgi:hypothetical protein
LHWLQHQPLLLQKLIQMLRRNKLLLQPLRLLQLLQPSQLMTQLPTML